jgi:hypothetical protein
MRGFYIELFGDLSSKQVVRHLLAERKRECGQRRLGISGNKFDTYTVE